MRIEPHVAAGVGVETVVPAQVEGGVGQAVESVAHRRRLPAPAGTDDQGPHQPLPRAAVRLAHRHRHRPQRHRAHQVAPPRRRIEVGPRGVGDLLAVDRHFGLELPGGVGALDRLRDRSWPTPAQGALLEAVGRRLAEPGHEGERHGDPRISLLPHPVRQVAEPLFLGGGVAELDPVAGHDRHVAEVLRRLDLRQQPADEPGGAARREDQVPALGVVDSPGKHRCDRLVVGQLRRHPRIGAADRLVAGAGPLLARGAEDRPHLGRQVVLGGHSPRLLQRRAGQEQKRVATHRVPPHRRAPCGAPPAGLP